MSPESFSGNGLPSNGEHQEELAKLAAKIKLEEILPPSDADRMENSYGLVNDIKLAPSPIDMRADSGNEKREKTLDEKAIYVGNFLQAEENAGHHKHQLDRTLSRLENSRSGDGDIDCLVADSRNMLESYLESVSIAIEAMDIMKQEVPESIGMPIKNLSEWVDGGCQFPQIFRTDTNGCCCRIEAIDAFLQGKKYKEPFHGCVDSEHKIFGRYQDLVVVDKNEGLVKLIRNKMIEADIESSEDYKEITEDVIAQRPL